MRTPKETFSEKLFTLKVSLHSLNILGDTGVGGAESPSLLTCNQALGKKKRLIAGHLPPYFRRRRKKPGLNRFKKNKRFQKHRTKTSPLKLKPPVE